MFGCDRPIGKRDAEQATSAKRVSLETSAINAFQQQLFDNYFSTSFGMSWPVAFNGDVTDLSASPNSKTISVNEGRNETIGTDTGHWINNDACL